MDEVIYTRFFLVILKRSSTTYVMPNKQFRTNQPTIMIRKPLCLLAIGVLAFYPSLQVHGQTSASQQAREVAGPERFWQASIGEGHFMVLLDRIISISMHQYLMDGGLIVDEVTVDTQGQALTRFYFIAPISKIAPSNPVANLAERGRELADKAAERIGTNAQDMVFKKYPDTTHAKSVEYRITSLAHLKALYSSLKSAWKCGPGCEFIIK